MNNNNYLDSFSSNEILNTGNYYSLCLMTFIIHIFPPFSLISITFLYCCTSKKIKNANGNNNSKVETAQLAKNSDRGANGVAGVAAAAGGGGVAGEEAIKTDKTQEETEMTQEISNNGENEALPPFEISPYPYEMFHRGFGKRKKKQQQNQHRQHGNEHPPKPGTKRTKQQQLQQQRSSRAQTPRTPKNDLDSMSQTQPNQLANPPSEPLSKPPQSEKAKENLHHQRKATSIDIPIGTDVTQSAICSTQKSSYLHPMDLSNHPPTATTPPTIPQPSSNDINNNRPPE